MSIDKLTKVKAKCINLNLKKHYASLQAHFVVAFQW
jgi:hypothetical protein